MLINLAQSILIYQPCMYSYFTFMHNYNGNGFVTIVIASIFFSQSVCVIIIHYKGGRGVSPMQDEDAIILHSPVYSVACLYVHCYQILYNTFKIGKYK